MEYTCRSCGDKSDRKILRKEMICTKCGSEIYADPVQLKSANRKMNIALFIMAVAAILLIIFSR